MIIYITIFWAICLLIEFCVILAFSKKKWKTVLATLVVAVPCCAYAYYNGSVLGQEAWFISDGKYYLSSGDYNLYRLCTFFNDCAKTIMLVGGCLFLCYKLIQTGRSDEKKKCLVKSDCKPKTKQQ